MIPCFNPLRRHKMQTKKTMHFLSSMVGIAMMTTSTNIPWSNFAAWIKVQWDPLHHGRHSFKCRFGFMIRPQRQYMGCTLWVQMRSTTCLFIPTLCTIILRMIAITKPSCIRILWWYKVGQQGYVFIGDTNKRISQYLYWTFPHLRIYGDKT